MCKIHKQSYKHINSKTVIVFIHGFAESPSFFDDFAKLALKNGYSYINLLLPGHGKTSKDFYKSGYKKWVTYVDSQIEQMRNKYENIILVGHSMGCLLSINSYLKNRDKIKGIFCINIPFNIRVDFKSFMSGVKIIFMPDKIKDDFTKTMKNRSSIESRKIYEYPLWIPRYLDLFYLSYKCFANLKNINVATIYLQSYKDGLVGISSVISLKNQIKKNNIKNATVVVLKNSNHYEYLNGDKHILYKCFLAFVKKYAN